jgi:hypothetical protein
MRTPYPLLLLWPPFSNEMAPDLVNGGNGKTLGTKLAPLLMKKLPGNQIEHKLFGFFPNQLHRHFVEAMTFIIENYLVS